jgi:hypothetical protein
MTYFLQIPQPAPAFQLTEALAKAVAAAAALCVEFKPVHPRLSIYSVRVGIHWRVVGSKEGEKIVRFWIGSHAEYDHLISQI